MRKHLIAAIDVGSHALRMKIGEISKNGEFRELENFRQLASLGHDTFTKNKVSYETVERTCAVLKDFKKVMQDYNVERYAAVATSAVREAENKDYIVDQINRKTGVEIRVLSNSEEQFLTHKAIKNSLGNYDEVINEGAIIIVIGAGSIQVTTYKKGRLQSSQNVKLGALRIRELLGILENSSSKYYRILEEFISVNLESLDIFQEAKSYKHLIAIGGEMSIILHLMGKKQEEEYQIIEKEDFDHLYSQLLKMTTNEIWSTYKIKRERAEIIVPSMMLFRKFLPRTTDGTLLVPGVALTDGLVRTIYEDIYKQSVQEETIGDIITCARQIGKKFNNNQNHVDAVESFAVAIFDRTKRLHGLKEEKVLLRVASQLHDIGKYIGLDQHANHSYAIIHKLEIFGLSDAQVEIVANVSKYHGYNSPNNRDFSFRSMSGKDRITAAKLTAILRLADALDHSHNQKLSINSIRNEGNNLVIRCESTENTVLEEWAFDHKTDFFEEVFGVTPILRIKRKL